MMKKIVGIFVMTLLITTALPAVGTMNDFKPLNAQQEIAPIETKADEITVTLNPTDDATCVVGYPDTNYGTETGLVVGWTPVDEYWWPFLKFDTSDIPSDVNRITSAKLSLYCYFGTYYNYDYPIHFFCFDSWWDENTITYNNFPDMSDLIFFGEQKIDLYDIESWFEYNVPTEVIKSSENFSFVLEGASYPELYAFYSKENGENIPKLTITFENNHPNEPTITGSPSGKPGEEYEFIFKSVDPDGDDVKYFIQWGDTKSEWTDFYPSGALVKVKHSWDNDGAYNIIAKAQDKYGADSTETAKTITITTPRTRTINHPLFLQLFERFPNLFPLLQQILG